ncbi:hypothetical protein GUITHDRAFT_118499 [Guillardia theta CCMP2712]|uniref:Phenazine biosynthesis-like domain-containing protein n=1 Tax=Guillardia theta (strain CCMP2712) TaxID=905079 RepID=L1IHG5_GUITC|nr:hypothetical protein GUITHDRAFT_118499 [Guillardia theta CCMP2712]EKX35260.1 hypothetical protein GUITHDRAFT_118499 [Guillardia theta CCMP2712]|mmetsp:Transcript_23447/g.76226  ORF Transcript_23447/g.76226 Transcript_23447/m.76226 type:complete len:324 (+) Transcript_23447:1983-2954(+)|eukprot:XP_005822240.1 hypothetical protein GUITHDRAFT_118499 [Guillardia theta CCMP2712]
MASASGHPRPSGLRLFQVDAFTRSAFGGNPAAVCFLPPPIHKEQEDGRTWSISAGVMKAIAGEMALSETAFLSPANLDESFESADRFCLRWFTPTREVDLCGHATMAAVAALTRAGNASKSFSFNTLSGELTAEICDDGQIELVLPCNEPSKVPQGAGAQVCVEEIAAVCLGSTESLSKVRDVSISARAKKLLIEMDSARFSRDDLENLLVPSSSSLLAVNQEALLPDLEVRGVMICLLGTGDPYDFVSRYFAPWNGIAEDAVTGAAHSVLAPYFAEKLQRTQLRARQCSPRGGDLDLVVEWASKKVRIRGHATVVLEGQLFL